MTQDELYTEIYRRIDAAIQETIDRIDREAIFQSVLIHYKATGEIPTVDFNLSDSPYVKPKSM